MSKAILVTGGAGYIGSHVCKELARAGLIPVSYDSLVRGHRDALRWGPLEIGDTRDTARLRDVIRRHKPSAVLHLAGFAYVAESFDIPDEYASVNVEGTRSLIAAMAAEGCDRLIFSSSCTVYGITETGFVDESMPGRPINPYGTSKLQAERLIRDASAAGLRSITLRYFNAAGADPDGEAGESHDPEPHLFPRVLMAAAGDLDAIDILGTDYATPDGSAVRDYVHVSDLAAAHVAAIGKIGQRAPADLLNLGTGRGYSVREIIAAAERVTGRRVPVREKPRRPGDPDRLVANAGTAAKFLGWQTRLSDLDSMIRTAWTWYSARRLARSA